MMKFAPSYVEVAGCVKVRPACASSQPLPPLKLMLRSSVSEFSQSARPPPASTMWLLLAKSAAELIARKPPVTVVVPV